MKNVLFSGLSDVIAWKREGKNVNPLDFVALEGKPSLLFAYAALMNPDLIAVDKLFYLSNGFSIDALQAWNAKGLSRVDIQKVINHIHIRYLMQEDSEDIEILDAAAKTLAEVWRKTLPAGVIVDVIGPGTADVALTFYQNM